MLIKKKKKSDRTARRINIQCQSRAGLWRPEVPPVLWRGWGGNRQEPVIAGVRHSFHEMELAIYDSGLELR